MYSSTFKSSKINLLLLILGKGSCDFETDWCGWRDDSGSGDSYWFRTMGKETEQPLTFPRLGKLCKLYQDFGPVYTYKYFVLLSIL